MFVAFIVLHGRGNLTLCVNQHAHPHLLLERGTRCDSGERKAWYFIYCQVVCPGWPADLTVYIPVRLLP